MATVQQQQQQSSIFISYARVDQALVEDLVEGLRFLKNDVWLDRALEAGEEWWADILANIARCDVFLQVISPAAMRSEACQRERAYAQALGKPMLPVIVEQVPALPSDLAQIHSVDYRDSNRQRDFHLMRALQRRPPTPPLPERLPPRPKVPMSYLVELSDRVRAPSLDQDEQLALVARLRPAAERGDDRDAAIDLLRQLRNRRDLYYSVVQDIDALLSDLKSSEHPVSGEDGAMPIAPTPVPSPDPNMYVSSHMGRAILAAFLFFPIGIFAVIAAAKVSTAMEHSDFGAARRLSKRANTLFWVSLVVFLFAMLVAIGSSSGE